MMSMKQENEGDNLIDSQIYKFPGRSKSSVWNHFGFQKGIDGELDKTKAVCKICRQGIRYSGNTTNLHCHLTKHRRDGTGMLEGFNESWIPSPDFKYVDSLVQSTVEDLKPGSIQSTSVDDDSNAIHRSKHQQLNDTIVNFFIEHLLPMSIVESTSFYSMIAVADPMYVVPDKEFLYGNLIQQSYNETKQSIEADISGNEVITTAEVWESITGEKFVSISCQLINSQWMMKSFLLKTAPLSNIQNEIQFLALMQTTFKEWGIKRSVALVNDGSKIMDKAFSSLCTLNMPFCKKIFFTSGDQLMKNTVTNSMIEYVIVLIGQILQSKSPSNIYEKILYIIKDYKEISTKTFAWTAFSAVISCLLEHKGMITNLTNEGNSEKTSSNERWREMEEMAEIISPLLKAYNLLADTRSVMSSMILPVLKKLEIVLAKKEGDSEFIQVLKKSTWSSVSDPFRKTDVRTFLLISSLLDPRYKDLQFVEATEKSRARDILATVATELYRERLVKNDRPIPYDDDEIIVVEDSGNVIRIEPMEKRPRLECPTAPVTDDWLAEVVSKSNTDDKTIDKEEKVLVEIDHYFATQQVSSMPLQWWSGRESLYPILSRLARRYLCMTNFSISDNPTVRNTKVLPETVDKLLVLHHNYFCGER